MFKITVEEGRAAIFEKLEGLKGEMQARLQTITSFIPATTIARHSKFMADRGEFEKLLATVIQLVEIKEGCEHSLVMPIPISPSGSTRSGSGLGEMKLAQQRKRMVEDELYKLFDTSYAEQSTTTGLVIPTDLSTSFLGLYLLDDIILYMRTQVLSYPIPFMYIQHRMAMTTCEA